MRVNDAVGRFGENTAADFLRDAGLRVIERNWRCRQGEIDIVALDGQALVIVEVKTRTSSQFGSPAEAVDHAKAARLRRLAIRWIETHRDDPQIEGWVSVRIDVVAVTQEPGRPLAIDHLIGAV
jgi:putative endonuclease